MKATPAGRRAAQAEMEAMAHETGAHGGIGLALMPDGTWRVGIFDKDMVHYAGEGVSIDDAYTSLLHVLAGAEELTDD